MKKLFALGFFLATLGAAKQRLYYSADGGGHAWAWCPDDGGQANGLTEEAGKDAFGMTFKTGAKEGCGIGAQGRPQWKDSSADLRPAKRLVVELKLDAGKQFKLKMSESGARHGAKGKFLGLQGADGEQWESGAQAATGAWQVVDLPLVAFHPRKDANDWCNTAGNDRLDLQAILDIGVYVPASEGSGTLLVRKMALQ